MREVLQELNREVGVLGSLLVTRDGVVMQALMGTRLDSEAIAANVSATVRSIRTALGALGIPGFSRFVCNAAFGKLVIVEAGDLYLVAVLDKTINLDMTLLAVSSSANRIKSLSTL